MTLALVVLGAAVLVMWTFPPAGPLALVAAVNLLLWRRARVIKAAQEERARARAEEQHRRALIAAMRSLR